MYKIFIDGRAGTTGLRIEERLSSREGLTLLTLPEPLRRDPQARKQAMQEAHAVLLCLPDGAAQEAAAWVPPDTVLIDASTAHRTAPGWAYGFPELGPDFSAAIQTGKRISVPGCHASGFVALIKPLIHAGILSGNAPLACLSLTGYSGGGKAMIADYESPARVRNDALSAPRQYAPGQTHKHLPEMAHYAGLERPPVFCPIVADYPCGMEVTVPLPLRSSNGMDLRAVLLDCYRGYYAGTAMVRVVDPDGLPHSPNAYAGLDAMDITVEGCDGRLLLIARFDNLGKGASGAAVQCLNLALGLEETAGLIV